MAHDESEFQIFVHNTIKSRFPQSEGYQIQKNPMSPTGKELGFLVTGPYATIVVAANDSEQVERSDIDQLLSCAAELNARNAIIYTTYETRVPVIVAEYAKARGVDVARTQWWQDD